MGRHLAGLRLALLGQLVARPMPDPTLAQTLHQALRRGLSLAARRLVQLAATVRLALAWSIRLATINHA